MGEYFSWVNVDKKQYLCPSDFDLGNKRHESMYRGNPLLGALYALLSNEWNGDRVIFLGDECASLTDVETEALQILAADTIKYDVGDYQDMVIETYRNVSCLFQEAEAQVRCEIGYYIEDMKAAARDRSDTLPVNEYGIDLDHPFKGCFIKKGKSFPYIINYTKKVYYSPGATKILYLDRTENTYSDPLPLLMGYGRSTDPGLWLGDRLGAADTVGNAYTLVREIVLDW